MITISLLILIVIQFILIAFLEHEAKKLRRFVADINRRVCDCHDKVERVSVRCNDITKRTEEGEKAPERGLREIVATDVTGRRVSHFYGHQDETFIGSMNRPGKRVVGWGSVPDNEIEQLQHPKPAVFDKTRADVIVLTQAEMQSGLSRVKWAEGLIEQLPVTHDGRNSWLLNYGVRPESIAIREQHARKTQR